MTENAAGWDVADMARLPMRWLSSAFGADDVAVMGYYGPLHSARTP